MKIERDDRLNENRWIKGLEVSLGLNNSKANKKVKMIGYCVHGIGP